jgi:hypothetical protein
MTYQPVKLGMMVIKIDLGQIRTPQTVVVVEMEVVVAQICLQDQEEIQMVMAITEMITTQIQMTPSVI